MEDNSGMVKFNKEIESILVIPTEVPLFPGIHTKVVFKNNLLISEYFKKEKTPAYVVLSKVNRKNNKRTQAAKIVSLENLEKISVVAEVLDFEFGLTGEISIQLYTHSRVELKKFNPQTYMAGMKIENEAPAEYTPKIKQSHKMLLKEINTILTYAKKGRLKISDEAIGHIERLRHTFKVSEMTDYISYSFPFDTDVKQNLLNTLDIPSRIELLLKELNKVKNEMLFEDKLNNTINKKISNEHKKNIIQYQIQQLQQELNNLEGYNTDSKEVNISNGGKEESDYTRLANQFKRMRGLPKDGKEIVNNELKRLKTLNPTSAEYNVCKNYLDTVVKVPWDRKTKDVLDVKKAKSVLDHDHYGMNKVKRRILQHLAVAQKKKNIKGNILCLAGPPGVGKTSLGKSIAEALGRKYVRISLGGVRDESEMRGHRRTYVGAMAGKFVKSLIKAKTKNPVIVLDEIDKLGRSHQGDPAAALLEILDPEQNHAFSDHYLEMPIDLSNVFFIATANDLSTIPGPLRDRMEIIEVPSYTELEKIEIADRYLVSKQKENNGLSDEEISFTRESLKEIVNSYTREAGVRTLQRQIGTVCRVAVEKMFEQEADKIEVTKENLTEFLESPIYRNKVMKDKLNPGVATGLAWTQYGGSLLYVESTLTNGNGQLKLTGNLGDVIKESSIIALSCLKSKAESLNLDIKSLDSKDLHIHFPEGATPKDGPSAGITLVAALYSLISQKAIDAKYAFTGEVTLTGDVKPVGGIREKVLAAKRHGMTRVIMSEENRSDVEKLDKNVIENIEIKYISNVESLIKEVFVK